MGSKFANLNIRGAESAAVAALCPDCAVRERAPGWVTAAGGPLERGAAQREARRLSRALSCPVLSTEYFDDDFVEFAVYQNGRRIARHVPAEYEGLARVPGRPGAWTEALGLPDGAERTLRAVFQETRPAGSLRLLECVLGCPLWVDGAWIDQAVPEDRQYLADYLARKRAVKRIRNRTALTLAEELPWRFQDYVFYPMVRREEEPWASVWDVDDAGRFRRICRVALPGDAAFAPGGGERTKGALLLPLQEWRDGELHTVNYVFSDGGQLLAALDGLTLPVFLDEMRLFDGGRCYRLPTGELEWDLGLGKTAYGVRRPCRLADGTLAVDYDLGDGPLRGYLTVFQPDGTGKKTLELPDYRHWDNPVVWGEDLYFCCSVSRETSRLTCYAPDLTERWHLDVPDRMSQFGKAYLDDRLGMLYFCAPYCRLVAVDLTRRVIAAAKDLPRDADCYLFDVLPGIGPVMLTGNASLQVWDRSLEPVSRHRAKGGIGALLHRRNRAVLLTASGDPRSGGPGVLRLYELKETPRFTTAGRSSPRSPDPAGPS